MSFISRSYTYSSLCFCSVKAKITEHLHSNARATPAHCPLPSPKPRLEKPKNSQPNAKFASTLVINCNIDFFAEPAKHRCKFCVAPFSVSLSALQITTCNARALPAELQQALLRTLHLQRPRIACYIAPRIAHYTAHHNDTP